ncbi:hypothetical protein GO988_21620 [Hymenobacter sp. HMF4947]|uniref:Uncharacterized protein n=1 Tax=Hymenobacter ginkgonis TaxID=2682976 RepID=A0A7K1TKJ5_9BACT|nr:hypothetical protein [Hymenobacter ginkgonis]MVN78937.1 hypothetical protein [Hymenobacter ginkgonis]
MKRYPKGPRAATPYIQEGPLAGVLVDGRVLGHRMVRAYNRHERWQYHLARRRLAVPRPPTAAQKTVARLRHYAAELATLLAPFRATRPNGHEELRGLLQDADTRPAIVTQVTHLRSCIAQLRPVYLAHKQEVDAWRVEWDGANAERRRELLQVHLAQVTQGVLNGLVLLSEEAQADAARIECFLPEAFVATAGQWWYSAPLNYWQTPAKPPVPTPYS